MRRAAPPADEAYAGALREKVYRSRPAVVREEGGATAGNRLAEIRVKFHKEGQVIDVKEDAGGEHTSFDASVLPPVRKAGPLPAPSGALRERDELCAAAFRILDPAVPR